MKLVCAPLDHSALSDPNRMPVVLYSQSPNAAMYGSAGGMLHGQVLQRKLHIQSKAWDLVSIALAVTAADLAGERDSSPDGWSREIDVRLAVADPIFWNGQRVLLQQMLAFLSTDIWSFEFIDGGLSPARPKAPSYSGADATALLSGGLDSLVANIDLARSGIAAFAVSQTVRGDRQKQDYFAGRVAYPKALEHLRVNHTARVPSQEAVPSQRARSLFFLAIGAAVSTTLAKYQMGRRVDLIVGENGFISLNPPLTPFRIGSLSTRTTHPTFIAKFQELLNNADINVDYRNPYQFKTKGEMLVEAADQPLLTALAHQSTSCGKFKRYGYKQCGACIPCLIRRAAFLRWGVDDNTQYKFTNLGVGDAASSDDVRSAAFAIYAARQQGLGAWLGASLASPAIDDDSSYRAVIERGLDELAALLSAHGVL